jgi:hypothetical protein
MQPVRMQPLLLLLLLLLCASPDRALMHSVMQCVLAQQKRTLTLRMKSLAAALTAGLGGNTRSTLLMRL